MKNRNPTKELWLLSFSAARMADSADNYTPGFHSWKSRCAKQMEKAVNYAATARDNMRGYRPGRIFYLQARLRRPQGGAPWNCRCVVAPIIKRIEEF